MRHATIQYLSNETCYYSIATIETCYCSNTSKEACHCPNVSNQTCCCSKSSIDLPISRSMELPMSGRTLSNIGRLCVARVRPWIGQDHPTFFISLVLGPLNILVW